MATNLQKLKAKRAANQKKENDLTSSYSIDEGISVSDSDQMDQSPDSDENNETEETIKEDRNIVDESVNRPEDTLLKPAMEETGPVFEDHPVGSENPEEPIDNIIPINNHPVVVSNEPERNLGLRLSTEEDKRYLDLAPLSRSMTKKAFFIELMEKEFENTSIINVSDPEVETFRNSSLRTTAMTIAVPESLIAKIKDYSARHMMKYQRYVAYVIYKARTADPVWKKMQP